jgi:N-acetylneuraminic acid mutarotase
LHPWLVGRAGPAKYRSPHGWGLFWPNGKFYAMGGRSMDGVGNDFTHPFEYDPVSNSWTIKLATYPDNQVNNMACDLLTDAGTPYIYCVGGSAGGQTTATDRVFRYDPVSDTIETVPSPWPGNSDGITLPGGFTTYYNDKLYILGGFRINTAMTSQIWEFTPRTNVWVQKNAVLPVPRGYIPTSRFSNLSGIYTGGGSLWDGTTLQDSADSFAYDPLADAIFTIANIPRATGEAPAVWMAVPETPGLMFVLGGGRTPPNPSNEVDAYDPPRNSWQTGPAFVTARRNFAADGDGYHTWLVGGYASDGVTPLSSMEIFCSGLGTPTPTPTPTATPCASVGSWTEQAPYPIAVSGHAVAAVGGNVYSFGGIANNTAIPNAYKYTPGTNTWTPIASLPAPRGWFSGASDGTYIYLLGGVDQNFNTTATLWRYDPVSNTYNTSLPSYTIPTYFHATAYLNGKIYRIAGAAIGTDFHVEVYDIATNTWSMAANYPFANHSLMAAAIGSYIYAGGGNASPDKTYRYDPGTNTWDDAAIADLPAGRSAAASGAYNGRWLLAGGDVNFAISNSAIAWDPATNTWSDLANMVQARDYLGGATAGQSFYAVAGNSGPGTPTNDNQQYTEIPCATPTPTPTATPTATATPTSTPTTTPTSTPRVTPTPRVAPTPRPRPTPPPRPQL